MYCGAITDSNLECERKVPILQADSSGCITPCHLDGKHDVCMQFMHKFCNLKFTIGTLPFCFTSCTKLTLTTKEVVPIVALSRFHPHCIYKWQCISNSLMKYPSTPVN